MERDNRDEDMMLKGTKQEMPDSVFGYSGRRRNGNCGIRILNFYFCFVGVEESATRTGKFTISRWDLSLRSTGFRSVTWIWTKTDLLCRSAFQRRRLIHFTLSC